MILIFTDKLDVNDARLHAVFRGKHPGKTSLLTGRKAPVKVKKPAKHHIIIIIIIMMMMMMMMMMIMSTFPERLSI